MKQLPLLENKKKHFRPGSLAAKLDKNKIYGGSIGYRKIARPLEAKKPIHIVFRVNKKLLISLRKNATDINKYLLCYTNRFNIKTHNHSINSNHIHLIISSSDTKNIGHFLRVFSAQMVFFYRKRGLKLKLWEGRPFTKVAQWGKHFKYLQGYILKNFKEVVGFCAYTPRNPNYTFLQQWGYG